MRSIRVRNQSGQSNALALVISGCKTALKSPTVACAGCIAVANARQPTSSWVVSSGDMRYRSTCDGCPAGNLAAAAAGGPPQANSWPLFCPQTGLWCALTPRGPARPPQSVQACRAWGGPEERGPTARPAQSAPRGGGGRCMQAAPSSLPLQARSPGTGVHRRQRGSMPLSSGPRASASARA